MKSPLAPESIAWSREHFRIMRDGGSWAVPRSGLIFDKRGNELHLRERMPHDKNMPITAAQLKEQQDAEFETIKTSFGAAGIAVVDKTATPEESEREAEMPDVHDLSD